MDSHTGGKQRTFASREIVRGAEKKAAPPAKPQAPVAPGSEHAVAARVIDQDTQGPISGAELEILDEAGAVVKKGQTDWQGTVYHEVATAGNYTVRIAGPPGFDEAALKIVEQPLPGFDERSLTTAEQPRPSLDERSLTITA